MPLLTVILTLIVVGVLLWLVNTFHTDGWVDQIDPERGSGYRRGDMADECFWRSTLRPALSRWVAELLLRTKVAVAIAEDAV